jgi:hypothetical protein
MAQQEMDQLFLYNARQVADFIKKGLVSPNDQYQPALLNAARDILILGHIPDNMTEADYERMGGTDHNDPTLEVGGNHFQPQAGIEYFGK